jgi:hypothetical protein
MAASHIALRARSYGSFPVSADEHDVIWLQHSQERIAGRRSLESRKSVAMAFPSFLDAFPVLRDASHHLRMLVMGAVVMREYGCDEIISDEKSPSLVYVLAGEGQLEGGERLQRGKGCGEDLLWGGECPTLFAKSRFCTVLVLAQADLHALKETASEHFAEFERELEVHRNWHKGEAEGGMSAAEVQEMVKHLVDAARHQDSATIRRLARDRKMLSASDPGLIEGGALHVAAMQQNHSCLETLLELDASPDARSGSGLTPIHNAALVGDQSAVKKLMEAKGNANKSNKMMRTPLHVAAQEGHLDVTQTLLKAGVNVDVQDSRLSTPVHLAARHGHAAVVKALLLAGCNLNKKDHHGRNVWNEARQWKDGDADTLSALESQERAAVYDMVHLVFTREKLLTDWGHPCKERDRCVCVCACVCVCVCVWSACVSVCLCLCLCLFIILSLLYFSALKLLRTVLFACACDAGRTSK